MLPYQQVDCALHLVSRTNYQGILELTTALPNAASFMRNESVRAADAAHDADGADNRKAPTVIWRGRNKAKIQNRIRDN